MLYSCTTELYPYGVKRLTAVYVRDDLRSQSCHQTLNRTTNYNQRPTTTEKPKQQDKKPTIICTN